MRNIRKPKVQHSEEKQQPVDKPFTVVGMGASAGGLKAFEEFFKNVPADCGVAFVLVQHLAPDHETLMPELLGRHSRLPVQQVEDETRVEPNHVYVIPPNATLTIEGDVLRVTPPREARGHRMPIDRFFESLAESQGEGAVCIVFSGTGTDGTLGLKAVKGAGGVAIAQDPKTADFDSMPRSAISTDQVDFVLPPSEMPGRVMELAREVVPAGQPTPPPHADSNIVEQLNNVNAALRNRVGHDFAQYKKNTVVRRVLRRMQILRMESVNDYLNHLSTDPKEAEALFHECLISVTRFFRDPAAFESLREQVIPRILTQGGTREPVRVWIPACATGEEAYSIAILLQEGLRTEESKRRIQIFATDLDERALQHARQGVYLEGISEHVPGPYLQRYFTRRGDTYRVNDSLRELCLFSPHNLISDPPFSRINLLSCRNLLIYLESDLQQRLMGFFRYSLQPSGYLFLGPSENAALHSDAFRPVDRKQQIFQVREGLPAAPVFFSRNDSLTASARRVTGDLPAETRGSFRDLVQNTLLNDYAPPCVVVDAQADILYTYGRVSPYLEMPAGVPTLNLLSMAVKGLRAELRPAIRKAQKSRETVVVEGLRVLIGKETHQIRAVVRPVGDGEPGSELLMVLFQDNGGVSETESTAPAGGQAMESAIEQLESDLRSTRDHLQTTIEELETSNEELKSSNEELLSLNEELQSANEELQSSKEELQSLNEELQTVNVELQKKIEELNEANSDLQNFFASTNIPTIFLGLDLRIKKFTPSTTEVFRLIDSDVNRPLADITQRFTNGDLQSEIREVLKTHAPRQFEAHRPQDDRQYVLTILPYRTVTGAVAGVVLTFVDVTELKEAEGRIRELNTDLQHRVEDLETLLDVLPVGVSISSDSTAGHIRVNRRGSEMLRTNSDVNVSKSADEMGADSYTVLQNGQEVPVDELPMQKAARLRASIAGEELRLVRHDNSYVDVIMAASPLLNKDGSSRGAIGAFADVTALNEARLQAQHKVEQQVALAALSEFALKETDLTRVLQYACELLAEKLGVEYTKVLELEPEGDKLRMVAGVGWSAGSVGTARVGSQDDSQAGYTLVSGAPVVVEDLTTETRFRGPALLLDHSVRSGMSVIIEGASEPWGVLGIHTKSRRTFPPEEVYFLQAVSNILATAIQREAQQRALVASEERLRVGVLTSPILLYTNDRNLCYTWIASPYLGRNPEAVLGKTDAELLTPEFARPLITFKQNVLETGQRDQVEISLPDPEKPSSIRSYEIVGEPLRDGNGVVEGLTVAAMDVTDRKRAEKEREQTFQRIENLNRRLQRAMAETHHRVKNNLQVVAALVEMQSADQNGNFSRAVLNRIKGQVLIMARIHDHLTQEAKGGNLAGMVSASAILLPLLEMLQETLGGREVTAELSEALIPIRQASSLSLLVNELVSNAIKHGRGRVLVRLDGPDGGENNAEGNITLEVRDEGDGFPEGFQPSAAGRTGLDLVEQVGAWDLNGQVEYRTLNPGGSVTVRFPTNTEPVDADI